MPTAGVGQWERGGEPSDKYLLTVGYMWPPCRFMCSCGLGQGVAFPLAQVDRDGLSQITRGFPCRPTLTQEPAPALEMMLGRVLVEEGSRWQHRMEWPWCLAQPCGLL